MHVTKMLQNWLTEVLPKIHSKRRDALGAVVSAAIDGGRLTVTGLGRSIRSDAKEKHNIKRADRVLSNENLQFERLGIYRAMAREIIGSTGNPIVLIDWSDIDEGQKFFLLRASTPAKGRSLTLYEEVHGVSTKDKPRTHRKFLKILKSILPTNCVPIVVTDAGFRVPWFNAVQQLGWDFVGRVRNRDKVKIADNSQWISAKSLYPKASEQPKIMTEACLTESNEFKCNLVLYKKKPRGRIRKTRFGVRARCIRNVRNAAREREPWLLATSLKEQDVAAQVVTIYSTRMQIEEAFRDLKCARCGLSLKFSNSYSARRLNMLVLIGSLAATFAWLLGKAAQLAGVHRQFQANSIKHANVLSSVFIGFQVFRNINFKTPFRLLRDAVVELRFIVSRYPIQT